MDLREQLVENFEDAFMALFMADVAEYEGEKFLKENERLKNDAGFKVPPELDRRCLRTINKIARQKRALRTGKKVYRVFSKLSVAAVIALALFTSAYAAFPAVRVSTLNLLIEVSDVATELTFGNAESANKEANSVETPGTSVPNGALTIAGYSLPESITAERSLVMESNDSFSSTFMYEGTDGSTIIITVQTGSDSVTNVNTEDALQIQNLIEDGYRGVVAEQDMCVTACIADVKKTNFIVFQFEGVGFTASVEIINEFITLN